MFNKLTGFARDGSTFENSPEDVVHETKRILLDSLGCALAAVGEARVQRGIERGPRVGTGGSETANQGTDHKISVFGAAFANAELIYALNFDAVLPPGHVAPCVIPGILAAVESSQASGTKLISANTAAHEISNRLG